MNNWTIKIIDKGYKFERDIFIFRRVGNKTEMLNGDGTATFYEEGSAVVDKPTLSLNPETLQAFADELAYIGIKPQKGFLEGKIEATEKHLEDMRKLVFKVSPQE